MLKRIAVGDIMTRKIVSVSPSMNLQQCAKELVKQRVNDLLLIEGGRLIGILTARDILWTITKKSNINLKNIRAMDIATKKVAVIKPSSDIRQALDKMKKYGFKRLPVMARGEVVGILTIRDILRVDPSIYSEINTLIDIKEEEAKLRKLAAPEEWDAEGLCDECDAFAPLLRVENRLLCPDCRDELY